MKHRYSMLLLIFLMAWSPVSVIASVAGQGVAEVQGSSGQVSKVKVSDSCAYQFDYQENINHKRVINPLMHSGVQAGVTSARNKTWLYYTGSTVTVVGAAALVYAAYGHHLPGYFGHEPWLGNQLQAQPVGAAAIGALSQHGPIKWIGPASFLNHLGASTAWTNNLMKASQKLFWSGISGFALYASGLDVVAKNVKNWASDIAYPESVLRKSKKALDDLEAYVEDLMEVGEITPMVFDTLIDKINKATKALEASIGFVQYTIGKNSDMVKQPKYNCFYRYIAYGMYPKLNKVLAQADNGSIDMNEVHRIVATIARESDAFFKKMV
ncbi:hypothetical protein JW872_03070 [Candidatus Babeliales bacterium]|nr:hypothetical protein [Candidatus Babeliales bacterium]